MIFARLALLVSVLISSANAGHAAVLLCMEPHTVTASDSRKEVAHQAAVTAWRSEVEATHGKAFTRWQLAFNRNVSCVINTNGFSCTTTGRPCTVRQVPPEKARVLRRGSNLPATTN